MMAEFWTWLFRVPDGDRSSWDVIKWWELRRIPFNLIVGGVGSISLTVFLICITLSGELQPGEDAVEPMLLFATPLLINALYCGGWFIENVLDDLWPSHRPPLGLLLFGSGLGLSLMIVALPAVLWLSSMLLWLVGIWG